MKKNLILSLLMLVGITACQKEAKSTKPAATRPALQTSAKSLAPAYTDLQLQPDGSYETYWNGCGIKVTGTPAWDRVKYPTLVDGVPVLAGSITTYDGTSSVDVINSGADGNVFEVTQVYASLVTFNSTGFDSDLISYNDAYGAWVSNGETGTMPDIDNYVKDSYSTTVGGSAVKTFSGKLIRVTTGSNLAIATLSYPLPTAIKPTGLPNLGNAVIQDSNTSTLSYLLVSNNGTIISAEPGTNHQYNSSITTVANGTYTYDSATQVFHYWGNIVRSDGTLQSFNVTAGTD